MTSCPNRDHGESSSGRTPDSNCKGISAVAHHRHKRDTNARRLVALHRLACRPYRRRPAPSHHPSGRRARRRRRGPRRATRRSPAAPAAGDRPSTPPRYDREPRSRARSDRTAAARLPGGRRRPGGHRPRRQARPRQEVDHRRPQPLVERVPGRRPGRPARQSGKHVLVTGRVGRRPRRARRRRPVALGHRRLPRRREARPRVGLGGPASPPPPACRWHRAPTARWSTA